MAEKSLFSDSQRRGHAGGFRWRWLFVVVAVLAPQNMGWALFGGDADTSSPHAAEEMSDLEALEKFRGANNVTVVFFYAEWCFWSQAMSPAFDASAQKLALHNPPVKLARIDSARQGNANVRDKHGISSYPTIKIFTDNVSSFEYDQRRGRGWQHIVKWVNEHVDRDSDLKSTKDVDDFLHGNPAAVIALLNDGQNSSLATASRHYEDVSFAEAKSTAVSTEIAKHLERHASLLCMTVEIGHSKSKSKEADLPRERMNCTGKPMNLQRKDWTDTFNSSVKGTIVTVTRVDKPEGWQQNLHIQCCDEDGPNAPKFEISVPSLVMITPHDEHVSIYQGNIQDVKAVDEFISARRIPLLMRMNDETADKIMQPGPKPVPVLFFVSRETQRQTEHLLIEAARKMRGRVWICASGMETPIERRLADIMDVEDDARSALVLMEIGGSSHFNTAKKYRLDQTGGLTVDKVVNFVTDFEQKRLRPFMKSEPIPPPEDAVQDHVSNVVGLNFEEVVFHNNQDVFVLFHAPWCGHCRKLDPTYRELGRKLAHVKSLKIARIDATRNEVEGMHMDGFPTMVLFKGGQSTRGMSPGEKIHKEQAVFSGERTVEHFTSWLLEHASIKFDPVPPKSEEPKPLEPVGLLDPSEEDL